MSLTRPPMMAPPGRTGRSRARNDRRRRGRVAAAAVLLALVVGAGAYRFLLAGDEDVEDGAVEPTGPSLLAVLAVRTDRDAFVAVIGSGGAPAPAAVLVPGRAVIEIPGAGGGTVGSAARLPGSMLGLSIANMLGVRVQHYASLDEAALAAAVDAAGGLTLDVSATVTVGERQIGPGPTELGGEEVAMYLAEAPAFERDVRWAEVLRGLLGRALDLAAVPGVDADDPAAVAAAVRAAGGAAVHELPVVESGGNLLRVEDEALPGLLASAFGIEAEVPLSVLVLNGNGAPGMGEKVARVLVGEGFRVVASENARTFDHAETEIRVSDPALQAEAERVRDLLGVGRVIVGEQGSGLADIMIVVGKDFLEV